MRTVEKEFYILIRNIIKSNEFVKMKNYKHHVKCSVYDHSVKVAYLCYKHHKRFKTKMPLYDFVRGALLHDYYLYDWHDKAPGTRLHGFTHPSMALKNAKRDFPDLTSREIDMIKHHMFPLTPIPPKTRFGWIVCFYDKIAAISDYCGKNKWKSRRITKK